MLSNFQLLLHKINFNNEADIVTKNEERFQQVRKLLPKRGVVGYITDLTPPSVSADEYGRQYYITQYTLSPIIIVADSKMPLVIGNYCKQLESLLLSHPYLILLHDFGDGVALLANRNQR